MSKIIDSGDVSLHFHQEYLHSSCHSCAASQMLMLDTLASCQMLMLNPAMASEYRITVGSFLYARVDKVEQSVLCLKKKEKKYYVRVLSPYIREHTILCHPIYHYRNICNHLSVSTCVQDSVQSPDSNFLLFSNFLFF